MVYRSGSYLVMYRYEPPYTPLTAEDIDREPPPPLPEKDSYMKSRLDRFYAEIAEYRPGMVRATYEETRKQGADTVDPREALAERCVISDPTFVEQLKQCGFDNA